MRPLCVVQPDVGVVVVVLARRVVRPTLDRLVKVLQRPPRRDELQHRCLPLFVPLMPAIALIACTLQHCPVLGVCALDTALLNDCVAVGICEGRALIEYGVFQLVHAVRQECPELLHRQARPVCE